MHRRRGEEFSRLLLLSGISNALLVSCFVVSANWADIRKFAEESLRPRLTDIPPSSDPLAAARVFRSDNELYSRGVQSLSKTSLTMTIASPRAGVPLITVDASGGTNPYIVDQDIVAEQVSYEDPGSPTAEEMQGMRVAPILRKDRATGQLEIGNFKSMTFIGSSAECLDVGYAMLGDTGTSSDFLHVLTASDAITIARICAKNGTVVISCRNEQITVSPRQARPDDKC